MKISKKNIIRPALITLAILLVPLIAMQFSSEVEWGVVDFIIIGTLLFGAALFYELASQKIQSKTYRAAFGVFVLIAVVLVWIELAVGIFD